MTKELRILLLEDSAPDAELALRELRKEGLAFTSRRVETEADFRQALQEFDPDLILSDYSLPGYNGLFALAVARQTHPETPFILVSGQLGEELAVDALKSGAADFVLKDRLSRLGPAAHRAVREAEERRQHRQAEAARRESEALYSLTFQEAPVGIVHATADGRFVRVNDRFCALLGYTREELLARDFPSVTHPKDVARDMAAARRVWTGELPLHRIEKRYLHKDGSTVWASLTVSVLRNAAGEPRHFIGVVEDSTERKAAEERLRLQSSALESAANGIVITDAQGTILWANPAFTKLTGYELAEVTGRNPRVLRSGRHEPAFYADLWQTIRAGRVWRGQLVNRRKDGTLYSEEMTITPVRDAEGGIAHFVAIKQDTTEQQRAEARLRDSEMLYHSLVETLPQNIFRKDPAGRFTFVNRRFCETLAKSAEEIAGKTDFDFFPPALAEKYRADDQRVIATGETFETVEEHQLPTGTKVYVQVVKTPLRDARGGVLGLQGIFWDITARRRAEEERKLMEIQLRQAHKLEAIGQLAAGIAHEINTPTQYVGDNIHFLQDAFRDLNGLLEKQERLRRACRAGAPPPEAIEELGREVDRCDLPYLLQEVPKAIAQSLEGVNRVAHIVRAMKDFAHPGTGEKTLVDLNRLIESTVTVSRTEWKYVADLVTDFDRELPLVPCLPGEFSQVILNLVVNAAHAIAGVVKDPAGGKGTITVSTRHAGEAVEIRVQDTGTGIPEAVRERVFEPFFTTKPVGKGTGQGLAIARSVVVDKHGGTITFETEAGRGTTFLVRLPVKSPPPAR